MAEVTTPQEIYVDLCRVCGECYKSKKEKCNLFQGKNLWKPNFTHALEEICGPVRYNDDKPRSVCRHCCSMLNKYYTAVSETARIRRLVCEKSISNVSLTAMHKKCAASTPTQELNRGTASSHNNDTCDDDDDDVGGRSRCDKATQTDIPVNVHPRGGGLLALKPVPGPTVFAPAEALTVTALNAQSRVVKVVCERRSTTHTRVLKGRWEKVGESLIRGRYHRLPKILFSIPVMATQMTNEVMAKLRQECQHLTSRKFNSVLRQTGPAALTDFTWEKVVSEWRTTASTFLAFLSEASNANPGGGVVAPGNTTAAASTEQIAMAMAGAAVLLRSRCTRMCAAQRRNSLVMRRAGAQSRCFERFSRLGICVSRTSRTNRTSRTSGTSSGRLSSPGTTASSGQRGRAASAQSGGDDWSAFLSVNRRPSLSQSMDLSEAGVETRVLEEEEDRSKTGSEPRSPSQRVGEASQSDGKREVNNGDSGRGGLIGIIPKILLANGRGVQSFTPLGQSHGPTCDLSRVKSCRVLDSSALKHRIQLSKKRKHRRPGKRTRGEMFMIPRVISMAVTSPPSSSSSSPPSRVYSSIFYSFPGSPEDDSLLKAFQGGEDSSSRPGGSSPRPLARIVTALTKKRNK